MRSNAPTTAGLSQMASAEPAYSLPPYPTQARWETALPWIVCVLLALVIVIGFIAITPGPRCRDGYSSESIGSQGACSHHGGVDRTWSSVGALMLLYGPALGLIAAYLVDQRLKRRRRRIYRDLVRRSAPPPDTDESAVWSYARAAELKIEVLYKGQADYEPRWQVLDYGGAKMPELAEGTAWRPKRDRGRRRKPNPGVVVAVRLVREHAQEAKS
jgi:hypothetical protein